MYVYICIYTHIHIICIYVKLCEQSAPTRSKLSALRPAVTAAKKQVEDLAGTLRGLVILIMYIYTSLSLSLYIYMYT